MIGYHYASCDFLVNMKFHKSSQIGTIFFIFNCSIIFGIFSTYESAIDFLKNCTNKFISRNFLTSFLRIFCESGLRTTAGSSNRCIFVASLVAFLFQSVTRIEKPSFHRNNKCSFTFGNRKYVLFAIINLSCVYIGIGRLPETRPQTATISQHSDFKDVIQHRFCASPFRQTFKRQQKSSPASFPLVRWPFTRGRVEKQLLCYCCFNVGGKMKLCGHCFSLFSFTHNNNNNLEGRSQQRQRSEVTYSVTLTGRTPTEWMFPSQTHRRQTSTFSLFWLSPSVKYLTSLWFFLVTYCLSFSLVEPQFNNDQVTFQPTIKRNYILLKVSGTSF